MNATLRIGLISAMLALSACAGTAKTSNSAAANVDCPKMGETSAMCKKMGSMMVDMDAMKSEASEPSVKGHMQKMHDQMGSMMAEMKKMDGGTGGKKMGCMMQGKDSTTQATPDASPPGDGDHGAHHSKE